MQQEVSGERSYLKAGLDEPETFLSSLERSPELSRTADIQEWQILMKGIWPSSFIFFSTKSCGEVFGFALELTSKRIVLMSFPLSLFPVRASNVTPSVQLTFPQSGFRVPQLSGGASITYWRPAFYVSLSLSSSSWIVSTVGFTRTDME